MPLTKEAILTADDLTRERVEVPEWGGDVWIAVLSGTERARFELGSSKIGDDQRPDIINKLGYLLIEAIQDEQGNHLFTEEDIPRLVAKNSVVFMRLSDKAMTLNGLQSGDVEELVKNSEGAPSATSTSD